MATEAEMAYGIAILDSYFVVLKMIRALSTTQKEIIPDYDKITKETLESLDQVRGAFTSREFIKDYLTYDISENRMNELEAFLDGQVDKLSDLDEEIGKLDDLYLSLKYPN